MEDVNAGRVGRVLTYPRRLLDVGSNWGRLVWCRAGPASRRIEKAWRWTQRPAAETSLDLVQPIPCAVIVDGVGRCCVLERPEAESEIGKLSLNVGGHVDEEDGRATLEATLMACLVRELAEEVNLPPEPKPRPAGVALDMRSIAGSRHGGYIYLKDAERISPKTVRKAPSEFDLSGAALTGEFATGEWLDRNIRQFDPWSYTVIRLREQILGRQESQLGIERGGPREGVILVAGPTSRQVTESLSRQIAGAS